MAEELQNAAVVYTQADNNPQAVWEIEHGLQTDRPVVDVFIKVNGVDTKILPKEIRVLTTNAVRITFSSPQSGTAVIA